MTTIAAIQVGRQQLDLDETAYRLMLERVTGKTSLKIMTEAELRAVVSEMRRMGFKPAGKKKASKRKVSDKAYVRLVFALWRSIGDKGGLEDGSPAALRAFVEKRTGVADPEWLTYAQADPLIRALKAMEARAAQGSQFKASGKPTPTSAKRPGSSSS